MVSAGSCILILVLVAVAVVAEVDRLGEVGADTAKALLHATRFEVGEAGSVERIVGVRG
jgi:hypothetical protein